jgi:hypothetical protein
MELQRLKIDELVDADGHLRQTFLESDGMSLWFCQDGQAPVVLPLVVLQAIMRRYARPFDSDGPVSEKLQLADGSICWQFKHHAAVDAGGRDYIAFQNNNASDPAVAAIAVSVSSALAYLLLPR